jgi:hypothetical protein
MALGEREGASVFRAVAETVCEGFALALEDVLWAGRLALTSPVALSRAVAEAMSAEAEGFAGEGEWESEGEEDTLGLPLVSNEAVELSVKRIVSEGGALKGGLEEEEGEAGKLSEGAALLEPAG